jgi:hypothetical protein
MRPTMRRNGLTLLLGAALLASPLGASAAAPRDLVRATAAVALAQQAPPAKPATPSPTTPAAPAADPGPDNPPPTISEVRAQKEREEAARLQAEKDKPEPASPYYKRWWFWVLTAAVVGGTVALGAWAVEPSPQPARACSLGVIGCFGDGRSGPR